MKFSIVLSWKMTGNIDIDADSLDEAIKEAKHQFDEALDGPRDLPFTYGPEYKDGSMQVEGESEG